MSRATWRKDEGGQAVVLIAIVFLALLMAVGLAIDAGQLYVARRTMQEAADSAAYAGAVVRYQGGTILQARAAAINDATLNGYTDGVLGFSVTVNAPPTSGLYAGDTRYVQVIISGSVRTALVPAQSVLTTVTVRGTAGAEPLNNGYAIMALDRGTANCPTFSSQSGADIHLSGGGILVNSPCTGSPFAAYNDQNNPCRFTITPATSHIEIGGSGTGFPPSTCTSGPYAGSPPLTVDQATPQRPDPFAGFPKPSTTGVTVYSTLPGTTLNAGIYTVRVNGPGGTNWVLNPGIYILQAGLDLAGNQNMYSAGRDTPPSCLLNCGVLIFNTHTNYPGAFRPGIDTCGNLNLQGTADVFISAMTTGTATGADPGDVYNNFVIYQDPACTNEVVIGGNATFQGSGTVYIPNARFRFDGQNATLLGSQLVAKEVDLQNGNITIDFNAGVTVQPILPRLSE